MQKQQPQMLGKLCSWIFTKRSRRHQLCWYWRVGCWAAYVCSNQVMIAKNEGSLNFTNTYCLIISISSSKLFQTCSCRDISPPENGVFLLDDPQGRWLSTCTPGIAGTDCIVQCNEGYLTVDRLPAKTITCDITGMYGFSTLWTYWHVLEIPYVLLVNLNMYHSVR